MSGADSTAGSDGASDSVTAHLESAVSDELDSRDAVAFVHVGTGSEPAVRYCQSPLEGRLSGEQERHDGNDPIAVAFDGETWETVTAADVSSHPTKALAGRLADRLEAGTVLTPARVPHDAALYLESAGFDLASTDVLERARATKTDAERERIAEAQAAAGAGIRRAASLLAEATIEDGRLVADGAVLTPSRLRTAIDEAIVTAGAFPAGNTVVNPDPGHAPSSRAGRNDGGRDGGNSSDEAGRETALRPGEPIVLETAPRGPHGYHGSLVRTLVVDSDGGRDRRAHVGATQSFRSAAAMLTADTESVRSVEADLKAEVRAFGFGEGDDIETSVAGGGLEACERPLDGSDEIEPGSVVRLESAVRIEDGQWLRIADLLVKGDPGERATYLEGVSRSLEPAALLEE